MRYLAILKDSLVETLDRKSLYFILTIAVLLILLCASVGFRELDVAGTLDYVVRDFGQVRKFAGGKAHSFDFPAQFAVTGIRETTGGSGSRTQEFEFTLTAKPVADFHRVVLAWKALEDGKVKNEGDPIEGISANAVADPGRDLEVRYLRSRFRDQMLGRVEIEPVGRAGDERAFQVVLRTSSRATLEGAHEISLCFGVWAGRFPGSLAVLLLFAEYFVAEWIGGIFGVMLAVIFTAGFVPGMLQKGTLDLLLAKPVRRPLVLLTKYAGGLFYVLIPASVLIGGCWLAISWRSGYWNFGFLTAIGSLAAVFAVLYSFAVFIGVLTRSTIASILFTIGLWFFCFLLNQAHFALNMSPELGFKAPAAICKTIETVRLGLPRTSELNQASTYFIAKGNLGPELDVMMEGQGRHRELAPKWLSLALSSVGFIVAMLGLACWIFSRRDY